MPTVTANSYIKKPGGAAPIGVLAPSLVSLKGTARRDRSALAPHPTVLAGGGHSALVAPHVMTMKNAQKPFNRANEPTHTITAGGAGLSLVAPVLTYAQHGGANRHPADLHHTICANTKDYNGVSVPSLISIAHGFSGGRREYPINEPKGTVTSGGISHALVAPSLIQTGYGERTGQAPRALDPDAPLGTVVAGGIKHAPVAAYLAQHNTERSDHNPGRDADAPMSTVTATGSQQTAVTAFFAKYYGIGDGAQMNQPVHTVTVRDRFGHVQADLRSPEFGPEHRARARQVAEFLREHGAWDGGEFVTLTIDAVEFVVVDIGLRMLTPRELFNAQGFPPDYVIEGVWEENGGDWTWVPFTKDTQVSCCGNSVCPDLAEALAAANCQHLAAPVSEFLPKTTDSGGSTETVGRINSALNGVR